MKKAISCTIFCSLLILLVATNVFAGDLSKKFGVGYGYEGLSLRYWINDKVGIESKFDFSSTNNSNNNYYHDTDSNNYTFGGGLLYTLNKTEHSRLIGKLTATGSTGSGNYPYSDTKYDDSTFKLALGLEAEWYFDKLPNLGFNAYLTGVSYELYTHTNKLTTPYGETETQTLKSRNCKTNSSLGIGVIYYF